MNAYRNDWDTYVAEDWNDLRLQVGGAGFSEWEWEQLEPESPLTILCDTVEDCPGQALIENKYGKWYATMRVKDWIGLNGRGLLCSTEA